MGGTVGWPEGHTLNMYKILVFAIAIEKNNHGDTRIVPVYEPKFSSGFVYTAMKPARMDAVRKKKTYRAGCWVTILQKKVTKRGSKLAEARALEVWHSIKKP